MKMKMTLEEMNLILNKIASLVKIIRFMTDQGNLDISVYTNMIAELNANIANSYIFDDDSY